MSKLQLCKTCGKCLSNVPKRVQFKPPKGGGPSKKDFSDSLVMAWVEQIERQRPGEKPAVGVQGSSLRPRGDFRYQTRVIR